MTSGLPRCSGCFYVVSEGDGEHGRCQRESPVLRRGSEDACWPRVELRKPGCGKYRHASAQADPATGVPR